VVDRSREAKSGSIVVGVVDGELTLKRLKIAGERVWLVAEHPDLAPPNLSPSAFRKLESIERVLIVVTDGTGVFHRSARSQAIDANER
jgi:SOS-response transcriptional repressor LexA